MADLLPALRPQCPNGHGTMLLREHPADLAASLGTWYDCPPGPPTETCMSSVLLPSDNSAALLVAETVGAA